MNGVHGLAGWRWLFIFDGVITLPMAVWGMCLPTGVIETARADQTRLLRSSGSPKQHARALAEAGREGAGTGADAKSGEGPRRTVHYARPQEDPQKVALLGLHGLLYVSSRAQSCCSKLTEDSFFICSENIGSYMNLWLKSLDRLVFTKKVARPS